MIHPRQHHQGRGPVESSEVVRDGPPLLKASELVALGERGEPALRGLDLELWPHEILGVAGVSGNGQGELAEVVVGLRRPLRGRVELAGVDVTRWSVRQRQTAGMALVPEDRFGSGLAPGLSIVHNLGLRAYRSSSGRVLVRWPQLARLARRLVEESDIRVRAMDQAAGQLSGGNAQKLILAREIDAAPKLLIAAQPTRGLDLGAAAAVRQRLTDLAAQGCAVLLISEDLDELMTLCARIVVLLRGRVVGTVDRADATVERVGQLMLGQEGAA